jgi:hypothetical protein
MNISGRIPLYGGVGNLRELVMAHRRAPSALAVEKAIKSGSLPTAKSQKCVDCGRQATCYDHRDYSKPLEVQAVCRACNSKRGPGIPYWDGDSADPEYIDLVVTVMLTRIEFLRRSRKNPRALAKARAKALNIEFWTTRERVEQIIREYVK